jgi:hypothetical protein
VLAELTDALDERGFASLADAVGYAHQDRPQRAARLPPAATADRAAAAS